MSNVVSLHKKRTARRAFYFVMRRDGSFRRVPVKQIHKGPGYGLCEPSMARDVTMLLSFTNFTGKWEQYCTLLPLDPDGKVDMDKVFHDIPPSELDEVFQADKNKQPVEYTLPPTNDLQIKKMRSMAGFQITPAILKQLREIDPAFKKAGL